MLFVVVVLALASMGTAHYAVGVLGVARQPRMTAAIARSAMIAGVALWATAIIVAVLSA